MTRSISGSGGSLTVEGLSDDASVTYQLQPDPGNPAAFQQLVVTRTIPGQADDVHTIQLAAEDNARVGVRIVQPADHWGLYADVFETTTQVYPV